METEGNGLKDGDTGGWKRSGDIIEDELKMYTKSFFYDCTFLVGDDDAKIFKCHKMILARASPVFEKMLFGDFQESAKGKDDPILLKNVHPEAFDLVMRFIYGNVREFHLVSLTCQVYRFAHEYQMDRLMSACGENLKNVGPEDVLLVYEVFKLLNDDTELEHYRKIILENTSKVLNSPHWTLAMASTIEEIFKSPNLQIKSEIELFEALLNWGKQNAESGSASEIRPLIDPALKQIRFRTMQSREFSELCTSTDVLCEGEKFQILMSINLGDAKYLPPAFSVSNQFRVVTSGLHIGFESDFASDVYVNCETEQVGLKFSIKGSDLIYLSGISLSCFCNEKNVGSEANLLCTVKSTCCDNVLAYARFQDIIKADTSKRLYFSHPVHLRKNTWYTISMRYFNKVPVLTKMLAYQDGPKSWSWEHIDAKFKISDDISSHTDISDLYFICS